MVDEDLHTATKDAYQVPLVWICPCCGGEQTWEWRHWNHKRLIDFVPRQPKTISSATIGGQPAEVWEQPKPGSFAGMKFGDDKDNHTVDEKARSAYWECGFKNI